MKIASALVLVLATSAVCHADDSLATKRNKALQKINTCIRRNEVSSRECKNLNRHVEILVEAYNTGDRSVLPTLFRLNYLTEFYNEALTSDPEGFLSALARLPKKDQQSVAVGMAGGMFRLRSRERYEDVRLVLARIADSSPTKEVAQLCLQALERNNAAFSNYFPPGTFTSRAADFQVYWYSREMYGLGEKPLWPRASNNETTYRFTYLGAFGGSKGVTLTLLPDGTAEITMAMIRESAEQAEVEHEAAVPREQVSAFLKRLDQSGFWEMPIETEPRGHGADWILEGTQQGKYHIVVRWCPNLYEHADQDTAFAQAALFLFELAGHTHPTGGC